MAGGAIGVSANQGGTVSGGIPKPMKKRMINRTTSIGLKGQLNKLVGPTNVQANI